MNKREAIQAMRDGKKVRHSSFSLKEWMKGDYSQDEYIFEDGVRVSQYQFWKIRQKESWWNGWSIVEEQ